MFKDENGVHRFLIIAHVDCREAGERPLSQVFPVEALSLYFEILFTPSAE